MNDTKDSLPEMLDPTDVCSAMDDLAFMEYCYSHFDVNHDHKVGLHEARAVREIDLSDSKVVSLRGIEYFSNLERLILDRSTVRELHLLQNTKLKEISAKGCVHLLHTELPNDLSAIPNNEIWYTTADGKIVKPHNADVFGANIVSNTYENGKGIISFDGDVTSIGFNAFCECFTLESITIPNSVTSIGDWAFFECSSLVSIDIPDTVASIGMGAFCECSSLESITILGSVTSIGDVAFKGCSSLASIDIPDSVASIGKGAFFKCSSLTSITIPGSVTSIGTQAFSGCSKLTEITISNSVSSIGDMAFRDCSSLASIAIPDSVTSIGKGAFFKCSSLTSITIPGSVTSIGEAAFKGCSSLAKFKGKFAFIDGRCLIIDGVLNSFAPAGITKYAIPDSVTSIGKSALGCCENLKSISIGKNITNIENCAFCDCSSLDDVTIRGKIMSIGEGAFCRCKSLRNLKGNFTSSNEHCLIINGCLHALLNPDVTEYTIPWGVSSIGQCAFRICSKLKTVTIADSVTLIGKSAFEDCSNLSSVYCKATTPPWVDSGVFANNTSCRKIFVPTESVDAYKSAKGWSDYADAIVGYDFEAEKKSIAIERTDKLPYYIFFDTETTGLPRDFNAPASETYNWPRMVLLAWIVANKQGDILKKKSCIIRPEGYTISSSATAVHGITTEKALREGESMKKVLAEFGEDLAVAKVLVAHNMEFDNKIVHAEYIRMGCENVWTNGPTKRLCTMMSSVNYCALPGYYDEYKWPKLQELHKKLFGYEFDDAHDALADIEATFKCYWELRKLGLIE